MNPENFELDQIKKITDHRSLFQYYDRYLVSGRHMSLKIQLDQI